MYTKVFIFYTQMNANEHPDRGLLKSAEQSTALIT